MTLESIKSLSHLVSRAYCYEICSTGELYSDSEQQATDYLCSCYLVDVKQFSEFCQWTWKSIVLIKAKKSGSCIGSTTVEKQSEVDGKGGWLIGCPFHFASLLQAMTQECFSTSQSLSLFTPQNYTQITSTLFMTMTITQMSQSISISFCLTKHVLSPLSEITINLAPFP